MHKKQLFNRLQLIFAAFISLFVFTVTVKAQMNERVFYTPYAIDSTKHRQLFVELDNLSFFKNDEFKGDALKGYTLPGFWAQLKATYYLLPNVKLEVGAHGLRYFGKLS